MPNIAVGLARTTLGVPVVWPTTTVPVEISVRIVTGVVVVAGLRVDVGVIVLLKMDVTVVIDDRGNIGNRRSCCDRGRLLNH